MMINLKFIIKLDTKSTPALRKNRNIIGNLGKAKTSMEITICIVFS